MHKHKWSHFCRLLISKVWFLAYRFCFLAPKTLGLILTPYTYKHDLFSVFLGEHSSCDCSQPAGCYSLSSLGPSGAMCDLVVSSLGDIQFVAVMPILKLVYIHATGLASLTNYF